MTYQDSDVPRLSNYFGALESTEPSTEPHALTDSQKVRFQVMRSALDADPALDGDVPPLLANAPTSADGLRAPEKTSTPPPTPRH